MVPSAASSKKNVCLIPKVTLLVRPLLVEASSVPQPVYAPPRLRVGVHGEVKDGFLVAPVVLVRRRRQRPRARLGGGAERSEDAVGKSRFFFVSSSSSPSRQAGPRGRRAPHQHVPVRPAGVHLLRVGVRRHSARGSEVPAKHAVHARRERFFSCLRTEGGTTRPPMRRRLRARKASAAPAGRGRPTLLFFARAAARNVRNVVVALARFAFGSLFGLSLGFVVRAEQTA